MTGAILVTGGTGQVGRALRDLAWPAGIELHLPPRDELDLARPELVAPLFARRRYAAVIHAGAYTAVDEAEAEPLAAFAVNGMATAALAAASAAAGTPMLYVSTDFVFDGATAGWREEDARVGPLNVYGASKLAGEVAVAGINPRHAIVRTAWLVGPHRRNFVRSMLALPADRPARVVADRRGCPTGAADLAAVLRRVALAMAADPSAPTGVFHFVNDGEATWHDLARETFRLAALRGRAVPEVQPVTTADYPTAARRPVDSRLSTRRLAASYGIRPRGWRAMLAETVATLVPLAGREAAA